MRHVHNALAQRLVTILPPPVPQQARAHAGQAQGVTLRQPPRLPVGVLCSVVPVLPPEATSVSSSNLHVPPGRCDAEVGEACLTVRLQKNGNAVKLQAMKTTLTLTSRGVVTLPAKLRRALGLKAEDQLIAETTPEGLLLRPAVTLPVEIYSDKRIREFDEAEAELAKVLQRRPAKKSVR
jgi:antitoxin PrlF